jgi:hypothetical protein
MHAVNSGGQAKEGIPQLPRISLLTLQRAIKVLADKQSLTGVNA